MKVFEEISDVIPSDAHQMARCSLLHHENRGISDIGQNPDTSWIFMFFFVLSAINLSKRFLFQLRFVGNIPYVVCGMTLGVTL